MLFEIFNTFLYMLTVLYEILIFIIGATSSISCNTITGYSRMENVTPVNSIYKSFGFP